MNFYAEFRIKNMSTGRLNIFNHTTAGTVALLAIILLGFLPAVAQYPDVRSHDYDPENGAEINELCAGCHGEFGQGGGGGEFPRLAGLPAKYLAKQLHQFKIKERNNLVMSMYATDREISATDLLDISIYHSQLELTTVMPDVDPETNALEKLYIASRIFNVARYDGDVERGRLFFDKNCAKCHGRDAFGRGSTPQLTGQFTDYIRTQIENFQAGTRSHKSMDRYIKPMTAADIEALLAFLSVADD